MAITVLREAYEMKGFIILRSKRRKAWQATQVIYISILKKLCIQYVTYLPSLKTDSTTSLNYSLP